MLASMGVGDVWGNFPGISLASLHVSAPRNYLKAISLQSLSARESASWSPQGWSL